MRIEQLLQKFEKVFFYKDDLLVHSHQEYILLRIIVACSRSGLDLRPENMGSVGIIGGGISGLALASALERSSTFAISLYDTGLALPYMFWALIIIVFEVPELSVEELPPENCKEFQWITQSSFSLARILSSRNKLHYGNRTMLFRNGQDPLGLCNQTQASSPF